jgi:predicted dehydrogenase
MCPLILPEVEING